MLAPGLVVRRRDALQVSQLCTTRDVAYVTAQLFVGS